MFISSALTVSNGNLKYYSFAQYALSSYGRKISARVRYFINLLSLLSVLYLIKAINNFIFSY